MTAVGVASILVPYPYAGAHQRANAAYLADAAPRWSVLDEDFDGERLLAEATRLRDDATRAAMAAAAAALGLPRRRRDASPPSCWPWARAGRCRRWPGAPPDGRAPRRDAGLAQPRRAGRRARRGAAAGRAAGAADHAARRGPRRPPGRRRATATACWPSLRIARQAGVPAFVLGNGSDLVVADAGIRGLVIRNRAKDASITDDLLDRRGRAARWPCSSSAAPPRR